MTQRVESAKQLTAHMFFSDVSEDHELGRLPFSALLERSISSKC